MNRFSWSASVFLCLLIIASFNKAHAEAQYNAGNSQYIQSTSNLRSTLLYVYKTSPTLQAAQAEYETVKETYPQARAGWLPTVTAETGIYTSDIESSNFGAGDGATTKDLTLSITQPVYRGGKTFAETDRARDVIQAGIAVLNDIEQSIFLDTVTVYMDVIRDRKILDLNEQNEIVLQKEMRAAQERLELGDVTETDVRQTQVRLAQAQLNTIEAQRNLDTSAAVFEQVVGYFPPSDLQDPEAKFAFPDTEIEMVKIAETYNPQIQQAVYQHQAAEHDITINQRDLYPQVSAYASHNKQYDPQPGIVDEYENKTIGLRASLALYQGGATRSRIRSAQGQAHKKMAQINETKRRIRQNTIRNIKTYLAAKAGTNARNAEVEAAEMALYGVREESRLGQRTVLDILDADRELLDAQISRSKAEHDEIIAQFALAKALGILTPEHLGLTK